MDDCYEDCNEYSPFARVTLAGFCMFLLWAFLNAPLIEKIPGPADPPKHFTLGRFVNGSGREGTEVLLPVEVTGGRAKGETTYEGDEYPSMQGTNVWVGLFDGAVARVQNPYDVPREIWYSYSWWGDHLHSLHIPPHSTGTIGGEEHKGKTIWMKIGDR
jgi:hypothetical protein